MAQWLYRIQPTRLTMLADGPTERESEVVSKHYAYLQRLTEEGAVLLAGRTTNTDPSGFGIVIFEAETESDAQALVAADPAVIHGVMNAELFPYRIALQGFTIENHE